MFTNRRQPILDIAALKWVMRKKRNFQDGVARFPLRWIKWGSKFQEVRLGDITIVYVSLLMKRHILTYAEPGSLNEFTK